MTFGQLVEKFNFAIDAFMNQDVGIGKSECFGVNIGCVFEKY
jgi:hypothetical protein